MTDKRILFFMLGITSGIYIDQNYNVQNINSYVKKIEKWVKNQERKN